MRRRLLHRHLSRLPLCVLREINHDISVNIAELTHHALLLKRSRPNSTAPCLSVQHHPCGLRRSIRRHSHSRRRALRTHGCPIQLRDRFLPLPLHTPPIITRSGCLSTRCWCWSRYRCMSGRRSRTRRRYWRPNGSRCAHTSRGDT